MITGRPKSSHFDEHTERTVAKAARNLWSLHPANLFVDIAIIFRISEISEGVVNLHLGTE